MTSDHQGACILYEPNALLKNNKGNVKSAITALGKEMMEVNGLYESPAGQGKRTIVLAMRALCL